MYLKWFGLRNYLNSQFKRHLGCLSAQLAFCLGTFGHLDPRSGGNRDNNDIFPFLPHLSSLVVLLFLLQQRYGQAGSCNLCLGNMGEWEGKGEREDKESKEKEKRGNYESGGKIRNQRKRKRKRE